MPLKILRGILFSVRVINFQKYISIQIAYSRLK